MPPPPPALAGCRSKPPSSIGAWLALAPVRTEVLLQCQEGHYQRFFPSAEGRTGPSASLSAAAKPEIPRAAATLQISAGLGRWSSLASGSSHTGSDCELAILQEAMWTTCLSVCGGTAGHCDAGPRQKCHITSLSVIVALTLEQLDTRNTPSQNTP